MLGPWGEAITSDSSPPRREAAGDSVPADALRALQEENRSLREALEAERVRFRSLVRSCAQVVWVMDAGGRIAIQSGSGPGLDWNDRDAVHPDDRLRAQAAWTAAARDRSAFKQELRLRALDGRYLWMHVCAVPTADEGGRIREWIGMCTDVTETREAAAHRELLLAELDHRAKNTLAVVQSIAAHTWRSIRTPVRFHDVFMGRLHSLARAHDLLTQERWEGAGLAELIRSALSPYDAGGRSARLALEGPRVRLAPVAATTLAIVFHELATNAAQYGALTNGKGRIGVAWQTAEAECAADSAALMVTWTECGGPPVAPPGQRGFGTRLIERSIPIELGGRSHLEFLQEGLRCRFWLPLSDKVALA